MYVTASLEQAAVYAGYLTVIGLLFVGVWRYALSPLIALGGQYMQDRMDEHCREALERLDRKYENAAAKREVDELRCRVDRLERKP